MKVKSLLEGLVTGDGMGGGMGLERRVDPGPSLESVRCTVNTSNGLEATECRGRVTVTVTVATAAAIVVSSVCPTPDVSTCGTERRAVLLHTSLLSTLSLLT